MKKTILFLHGALGSKEQFGAISEILQNTFDVHSINFEGHGDYFSEKDFTIDLFTKNLKDYIESQKLSNLTIFGYSMGGYVALNLAKTNPELIDKIITYGTKFDWNPETSLKEISKLNPSKIEEKVPHFAKALEKIHSSNDWKVVMRKTADLMLNLGNGEALSDRDFSTISVPTLICVGSNDNMVSIEESLNVKNQLKNSELKIIPEFVHPFELNDLNEFIELLINNN
jgi:pimeloyl-ACP methyl ester carboxylesterase